MSTNGLSRFALDGRVAVITGAGTGIGRGVALVLAEHGADIVLAARRPEPLEETARDIEALGRLALVVPTDVTDLGQCERLVDRAVAEFGRLDILVNNAGGSTTKPIAAWTPEEWHQVVDLNLGSVWFLSRFAVEPMIERGKGAIVNISSGSSLFPFPMGAPYGASKAAISSGSPRRPIEFPAPSAASGTPSSISRPMRRATARGKRCGSTAAPRPPVADPPTWERSTP